MSAPLSYLWDQALSKVLPDFYESEATPQTLYRIKAALIEEMRPHLLITKEDARRIRVEWIATEQSVNLIIPPKLLNRATLH